MPGRPHHSPKLKSCVEQLIADGKEEGSAYAICTASLQKAGEPIFAEENPDVVNEARVVHLLGVTGTIRTGQHDGREHIIVPVVALMEGVIHAVNAATPEYVPFTALATAPQGWNGRPLVFGHPTRDGRQISANDPTVLQEKSFGQVFNARLEGRKLLMDAYIDPAKVERIGAQRMLERIQKGELVEVSVGAFVTTNDVPGSFHGKNYQAEWKDIVPDHLAFLENKTGACSCAMGCGAPRHAELMVAEEYELVDEAKIDELTAAKDTGKVKDQVSEEAPRLLTLTGDSLTERIDAVNRAVYKKYDVGGVAVAPSSAYAQQVYDDHVIVRKDDELYSCPYTVNEDGEVVLGDTMTEVEMVYVTARAKYEDCPTCNGSGNKDGNPCPACDGKGELRAAVGKRNSAADMKIIQGMHDHAVSLGAKCDGLNVYRHLEVEKEPESETRQQTTDTTAVEPEVAAVTPPATEPKAAASREGVEGMTKEQKAEVIKTLVGHKHSGFTAGDEAILEAASDERLESFLVAAESREKEVRAAQEEAARPKTLTTEEFMRVAPPELQTLISRTQRAETERKADLVTALKAAQSEYSESELSAMKLDELERMARVARIQEQTPSYEGRAVPRAAAAAQGDVFSNPPDPYAPGLAAMRGESKTIQ